MKKSFLIILAMMFVLAGSTTACSTHKKIVVTPNGKIPPGQAKKITGEKSAKNHAPGQRKKN